MPVPSTRPSSASIPTSTPTSMPTTTVWHAVRPWTPRFALVVREVTSVSATFVLRAASSASAAAGIGSSSCANETANEGKDESVPPSSNKSKSGPVPNKPASNTNIDADADVDVSIDRDADSDTSTSASTSLVHEAFNRGLSVTVNGAPWKRVLMRMDEAHGEAVIVLFGLMPGRQYDVELGILLGDGGGVGERGGGGEGERGMGEEVLVQMRVVLPGQQCSSSLPEGEADTSLDSVSSFISDSSPVAPAVARTHSAHQTSSSASAQPTFEDYAATLHATLAQLTNEHATLHAQLKSARRDAQKADGALRSEIESLKRAADKTHTTAETRGRQKVLALQEAVKQALAATQEIEEEATALEAELPGLKTRERDVEEGHRRVETEAARHQQEYDSALRADRAKTSGLAGELGVLTTRVEKLKAKKEKLGAETVPELERELERLVREVALVERDAGAFEVIDAGPVGVGLGSTTSTSSRSGSNSTTTRVSPTPTTALGFGAVGTGTGMGTPTPRPAGLPPKPQVARTLSSRAPPFDPGLAFRHGQQQQQHRPSLTQSVKSSGSSGSSVANLNLLASQHSHGQSLNGGGGGGGGPVLNSTVGLPVRPVSPARQASLPVKMPSYAGKDR